jgi:hypothetical protein
MGGVARIERGAGRAGDLDPLAGGEILDYAVEILQRRRRDRAEVEQLGTPLSNVIVGWIAPVPTVESNSSTGPGVLSISKEMMLPAVASTAPWMSPAAARLDRALAGQRRARGDGAEHRQHRAGAVELDHAVRDVFGRADRQLAARPDTPMSAGRC